MTNVETDADKEFSRKKQHESLEERCKALRLKCAQQSKRVRQLIEDSDNAVRAAKVLVQGISEN
jgi:hypothetical protein